MKKSKLSPERAADTQAKPTSAYDNAEMYVVIYAYCLYWLLAN